MTGEERNESQPSPTVTAATMLFRADQRRLNDLLGRYEAARPGPEQWQLEEEICAELKHYM